MCLLLQMQLKLGWIMILGGLVMLFHCLATILPISADIRRVGFQKRPILLCYVMLCYHVIWAWLVCNKMRDLLPLSIKLQPC
jgi:hypothetical protein